MKAVIASPIGKIVIKGNSNGISEISTHTDEPLSTGSLPPVLEAAAIQLDQYFNGERTTFNLDLNPSGTDFQKSVWERLMQIPYGKTYTYSQLAIELGDVKSTRAVAAANSRNPIWIVIPCHRVVGSDGGLTGYAGGIWRKKWLLEHENPSKQQKLFVDA